MRIRKKIPRKEWTSFSEVEELIEKLQISDIDFIMIANCSSSSFYLWKRKYQVPANVLSIIREELAKYFKSEYDKKCEIIWGRHE